MKYNIAVEKVYPEISEVELFKNTDSILGVSLESPFFERSSLNDIVEWCSLNFENTNILIGDSLHKYSEAIATGAPLKEAERKSISKGDSLYARFEEAIMKIGKDSFTITRWKNIVCGDANKLLIKEIEDEYLSNEKFKNEINRHAKKYIDSLIARNKNISVDLDTANKLSTSYILEELGVFNMLFQTGLKVFLYPGSTLPVLISFADGRFSEMTTLLDRGIYVQLKVAKKR